MSTLSTAVSKIAKVAGVVSFPKKETSFPALQAVTNVINTLWPKKTSAHIRHFIQKLLGPDHQGPSERTVRFWLAGETRMSVEALIALLRTDEGYAILVAVMGDSRPEWWLDTMMAAELRESRRLQRIEQRRTARLKEIRAQREMYEDQ